MTTADEPPGDATTTDTAATEEAVADPTTTPPAAPAKRARATNVAPAKRAPAGTARTTTARTTTARATTARATTARATTARPAAKRQPAPKTVVAEPVAADVVVAESADAAPPDATSVDTEAGGRSRRLATWPERAVAAGTALAATDLLVAAGVVVTGLVANGKQGPVAARLGTAFVDAVGTADGLVLVIAAGLLAWASRAGAGAMATTMGKVVLGLAVMFFVAAPLAAWGNVAYLHHSRQAVDGVVRAQLATWMAAVLVPTGVAAILAWWVVSQPA